MSDCGRESILGDLLLACLFRVERDDWEAQDVRSVAEAAVAVDLDPASALSLIVEAGVSTPADAAIAVRDAYALPTRVFEQTMRQCGFPPAIRRHLMGTSPDA